MSENAKKSERVSLRSSNEDFNPAISLSNLAKEGVEGVILEGVFSKVETLNNKDGDEFTVYSFELDNGDIQSIYGGVKALDDQMSRASVGDYCEIEYRGKIKGKSGRKYHDVEVFRHN